VGGNEIPTRYPYTERDCEEEVAGAARSGLLVLRRKTQEVASETDGGGIPLGSGAES